MIEGNDGDRAHLAAPARAEAGPWAGRRARWLLSLTLLAALAYLTDAGSGVHVTLAQATTGPERSEAPMMKDGMVDIRRRRTSDLAAACLAAQGSPSSWCSAYLMGVADTLTAMGNGGHKGGICHVDYGIEDLPGIFLTFARENDRFLNVDMLAGASLAFRQRWPCRG